MQNGIIYINNNICDKIIADPQFRASIVNSLKVITADGKIDQYDIPELVIMVLDIYNNIGKFKIEPDDFVGVMTDVICRLLNEYNLVREDQKYNTQKLISAALRLAAMQIKLSKTKCSWNCFKKKEN
jgi:hypothetical protein